MLNIKIKVDGRETLKELNGLSAGAYMAAWSEAIMRLVREKARKLGRTVGPRAAGAITAKTDQTHSCIQPDGPDSAMAVHIHTGGPIQSRSGKMLAIPTRWNPNKEDFASTYGKDFFQVIRSRKRDRAYLVQKEQDGKPWRPMFVLLRRTKPQKPRPWWPDDAEIATATVKFFEEEF